MSRKFQPPCQKLIAPCQMHIFWCETEFRSGLGNWLIGKLVDQGMRDQGSGNQLIRI